MKRILLFSLLGLVVLLLIALLLAIKKVDYTPYFETDYYRISRARQDSVMKETRLAKGALQIGFGRVHITPEIGSESSAFAQVPLAGYGDRKGVAAEGVHDSLYVSAIAIEVGDQRQILVSADMLIVPANISAGSSELAQEKLGIGREQIIFSATHTHSSMGGWADKYVGEMFGGALQSRVGRLVDQPFCSCHGGSRGGSSACIHGSGEF